VGEKKGWTELIRLKFEEKRIYPSSKRTKSGNQRRGLRVFLKRESGGKSVGKE